MTLRTRPLGTNLDEIAGAIVRTGAGDGRARSGTVQAMQAYGAR